MDTKTKLESDQDISKMCLRGWWIETRTDRRYIVIIGLIKKLRKLKSQLSQL